MILSIEILRSTGFSSNPIKIPRKKEERILKLLTGSAASGNRNRRRHRFLCFRLVGIRRGRLLTHTRLPLIGRPRRQADGGRGIHRLSHERHDTIEGQSGIALHLAAHVGRDHAIEHPLHTGSGARWTGRIGGVAVTVRRLGRSRGNFRLAPSFSDKQVALFAVEKGAAGGGGRVGRPRIDLCVG